MKTVLSTISNEINEEHEGAVAAEYIIILVIMAVCIFAAWTFLKDAIKDKALAIANFIGGNGSAAIGTKSYTGN